MGEGERSEMIVRKRSEGGVKMKKPLGFGRGLLLHSRDCENGRRECVWHVVCVRVSHVCVRSCALLSLKETEAGQRFRAPRRTVVQKRASEMFASHLDPCENASSFSCHVKWRQIKGPVLFIFSLKVMPRSAVLQIHFYVFSSNQTSFCPGANLFLQISI